MVPLEILIPSLCLNLIYIILKILEHKKIFRKVYSNLCVSKNKLENSISNYNQINSIENKNEIEDDIINFMNIMIDLTETINFKTI